MKYDTLIKPVIEIAIKAGEIIMSYYSGKLDVQVKEDDSPLTKADIAANEYIVNALRVLNSNIPIVSEEGDNDNITGAKAFWLVDPLDGTKSFIKHTGEFTVNIGLVEKDTIGAMPVMGVINIPAKNEVYYTGEDGHAYKFDLKEGLNELISVSKPPKEGLRIVASHMHRSEETDEYIKSLGKIKEIVPASSSAKFCTIASGFADVYPRFGRTMEWDTAAGHAILLAAGGQVHKADGSVLTYGKPGFINPDFVARGLC